MVGRVVEGEYSTENTPWAGQDAVIVDDADLVRSASKFGIAWAEGSGSQPSETIDDDEPNSPEIARYTPPKLSRAFSAPLPSQLGYLRHPHESTNTDMTSQFHELSVELADSIQMIVQTLLRVSPPQLLDQAKEQFSACALTVPTSSMSAMFTSAKNLNYISANMEAFCSTILDADATPSAMYTTFDIAETLQNVGDALSGIAAQAGVDLIIFHSDVGMRHVSVRGDESSLSFALSHIIRQVLAVSRSGDSIEIGLSLTPLLPRGEDDPFDCALECVFEIGHKFFPDGTTIPTRAPPALSSFLFKRVLPQIQATFESNFKPRTFEYGIVGKLSMTLQPGTPKSPVLPSFDQDASDNGEPSVEQLMQFTDLLRSRKVKLYASAKGSFAHHLTSYLTAWGMDVSHASAEAEASEAAVVHDIPASILPTLPPMPFGPEGSPSSPSKAAEITGNSPSFILIDDDVVVLRQRLQAALAQPVYPLNLNLRKRPSLAANHRPRSSPYVARSLGLTGVSSLPTAPEHSEVIVHFTSLTNYKSAKDVIQSVLGTPTHPMGTLIPEVMIIPKPAGPRRLLTALHTAVTRPTVDPFFVPIATSPMTPGSGNSSFNFSTSSSPQPQSTNKDQRPSGSRSNSDRSARSPKESYGEHHGHPPPSPLSMSDNVNGYFSDSGSQVGDSPSSGVMVQSPNGQPTGIFFGPRTKTSKSSSMLLERDKGKFIVPTRAPIPRRAMSPPPVLSADADTPTVHSFSALHVSTSQHPSPTGSDPATPKGKPIRKTLVPSQTSPSGNLPNTPFRRASPSALRKVSGTPPASPRSETGSPSVSNSPSTGTTPIRRPIRRATGAVSERPVPPTPGGVPAKKPKLTDDTVVPPIRVLVVDDNSINRTILSTFLKKKKIAYDVAKNGQEAVEKWQVGGFHLILMDIQMPVMSGIDATKEIRRMEKSNASAGYPSTPRDGPLTPFRSPHESPFIERGSPSGTASPYRSSVIIVALTASSAQSDRVAALAAGCNDFLTKPVSLVWLNTKIREWGSIKALQMWEDLRPNSSPKLPASALATQREQAAKLAKRLHVPEGRASPAKSPTLTPARPLTPSKLKREEIVEENEIKEEVKEAAEIPQEPTQSFEGQPLNAAAAMSSISVNIRIQEPTPPAISSSPSLSNSSTSKILSPPLMPGALAETPKQQNSLAQEKNPFAASLAESLTEDSEDSDAPPPPVPAPAPR